MGIVAQTRHQLARELIEDLTVTDAKIRAADKQLRHLVAPTGSSLGELNGIGASAAARLLGDIGDVGRPPRVLTVVEMQAILDGCTRLRDRFLWALLCETGMRVGEALGLRHEDIDPAACQVSVVPRPNANGARVKSGRSRVIRTWPGETAR